MHKPKIEPYVGITGVQTPSDVAMSVEVGSKAGFGPDSEHNLMLGALVSPATIRNEKPVNTSAGYRHVAGVDELVSTLAAAQSAGVVTMIHMELHKSLWGTPGDADEVIKLLRVIESHGIKPAVQLNGVLLADEIKRISDETGAPLVLQFRKELVQAEQSKVLEYVSEVKDAISKILVDPSMGTGATIDLQSGLSWYYRLAESFTDQFNYGFAGGLGGLTNSEQEKTKEIVKGIASALGHTEFSVDIESKARSPIGEGPEDRLDRTSLAAYFMAVRSGLGQSS